MILSRDLVYFINPPKYLSVLIAYTVAADVLLIFEKRFPNDLRPRKAAEVAKMYLDGYDGYAAAHAIYAADAANVAAYAANVAAYAAAYAAYAAAPAYDDDTADLVAYYAAYAAANAANAAYVAYYVDATDVTVAAYDAADYAAGASSGEHIFNLILSLFPQMIDYAVENQIKLFTGPGDFSGIFEMLTDEQKKLVIFNMDVIGNWK